MKIVTVIGARPQIIKAAAVSRAIRNKFSGKITEVIVHTGQHYDANMSDVFFEELGIPQPNYNLGVGSGSHAQQTAGIMIALEKVLIDEKPQALLLYGDTNSTLAGALVGSKMNISIVHVEAGLRSFNKNMPEEINRITCDHTSALLFSPTKAGYENLLNEGFKETSPPYSNSNPKIYHCGDVMYDNSVYFSDLAQRKSDVLQRFGLQKNNFIFATVHRDMNADSRENLGNIFSAFISISDEVPVLFPLHPRTKKQMEGLDKKLLDQISAAKSLRICEPLSYLDTLLAESNCRMVITDSGGVQKEAFFFRKPCVVLRGQTEWVELVSCGAATLCNANENEIVAAFKRYQTDPPTHFPPLFGDGHAADFICTEILKQLGNAAAVRN